MSAAQPGAASPAGRMLAALRTRIRRWRSSAWAYPVAVAVGLALIAISEASYWLASGSMDDLGQIGRARTSMQLLHRLMLDAETGQRGYLLTGNADYLAPYRAANEEIAATLAKLRAHFRGTPQAGAMQELEHLVLQKSSELQEVLALYDRGQHAAWRELMVTGIGREQMERIRTLSEQLLAHETAAAARGRAGVYRALLMNRVGVGAMTLASLFVLMLYLRQHRATEQLREAQRLATQAERDQLEREVLRRTHDLSQLARHLQNTREDERHRLARELHDELGALLTAAKLDVARLRPRIAGAGPEALERLEHLSRMLNDGVALKRRIIEDLRPSALDNLGLVAALEILTREHAQRNGMEVECLLEPVPLGKEGELTVYRFVQEALTNACKHAKATRIEVRLGVRDGQVQVGVSDDGAGFDVDGVQPRSHGLAGMRYRFESAGGRLDIFSAPGQGTRLEAVLPAEDA
ncbi:CHASE3 domain-containing protein [Piscinibacter sp.]|uniref:CHASE3 domain-containing protein n=1 Tax=Piscinibacter sp. TaxID=1903157 RepID=UPI0039E6EEB8